MSGKLFNCYRCGQNKPVEGRRTVVKSGVRLLICRDCIRPSDKVAP